MEKEVKHLEKVQNRNEAGSPSISTACGQDKSNLSVTEDTAVKSLVSLY